MPRVPTLSPAPILADPRPQVRQQAPDADAFGAGLGQGIEAASRTAFGVWQQEMQRATRVRVQSAENELTTHELQAQRRLEEAQGEHAPQAFEREMESLRRRQGEIEAKLANPAQREAFRLAAETRLLAFENRGAAHVVRETRRADSMAIAAAVDLSLEQARADRGDTHALGTGFIAIRQRVEAWAERQGLPAEERQREVQRLGDRYGDAILTAHLEAGEYRAADQFLRGWGGHFSEGARAKFAQAVQRAAFDGESRRIAGEIVSAIAPGPFPDIAAAEAAADRATDGASEDLRAEVRRRAVHGVRQRSATWTEMENLRQWRVLGIVTDPANRDGIDTPEAQQLLREMDPQHAAKLRADIAKASMVKPDPVSSRISLANYEALLTSPDPELRAKAIAAGPLSGIGEMTTEDQRAAVGLWATANKAAKGDRGARQEIDSLSTKTQAVHDVLRAAGYDVRRSDADGFKSKETAAVIDWIDREAGAMQAARTDRRPWTAADWRTIAGKAVAEQALKGRGTFGGDITARTADLAMRQVAQIPPHHRGGFEERFNAANGRLPTATELLQMWALYQQTNPDPAPGSPPVDTLRSALGFAEGDVIPF